MEVLFIFCLFTAFRCFVLFGLTVIVPIYPLNVRIPGVFAHSQVLLLEVQYFKVVQIFIDNVKCAEK